MKKPKSAPIFNERDFPLNLIRGNFFHGTGYEINELKEKPFIGIVNSRTDINPGHAHLDTISARVKEGVHAGGGIPFEFSVPAPCDGMTEGHEGMRFVLAQRDLIADIVETHTRSMLYDGLVFIASCDKIIPGMVMAAARLNLPAIVISGGPMLAGTHEDREISLSTMFEAVGARKAGLIDEEALVSMENKSCPGCGSCSGMYTANSMNCLCE
ncbi:MAG TPA: dihydroxy-acid dehydratase, partial [Spirochaetota bacterium]|nr:dihydroxy-acid dehydratase [Spirochaetota bacterium]